MSPLPGGLQPYKRTTTFTKATVPAGLLADHSIEDGVCGLIHFEASALGYLVTNPCRPASSRMLTSAAEPAVIAPTILHRLEPAGWRFHVEFLRPAQSDRSRTAFGQHQVDLEWLRRGRLVE